MTDLALDCPPLFATPRDPARETLGGAVAEIAEQLGTPFMPWQRQVADVALELGVLVHRCRTWARSRVLYSAQDRIHARAK
jgi:hypothetical protein